VRVCGEFAKNRSKQKEMEADSQLRGKRDPSKRKLRAKTSGATEERKANEIMPLRAKKKARKKRKKGRATPVKRSGGKSSLYRKAVVISRLGRSEW